MLSKSWDQQKSAYDFVVVGSGYGGAIAAARIAGAQTGRSVCLLERGKEWPVGMFPDSLLEVGRAFRSGINPLGLYELLSFRDISVIQGSGLGGTSLVNANVAIVPDEQVFQQIAWPRSITRDELAPYYQMVERMLAARVHPRAMDLLKVQALDRRAREVGTRAEGLKIAVNFTIDGLNPHGVPQKPCIDCGDCVTGCNVGAKNTVYMNYLPAAKNSGTDIFTQAQVDWVEKLASGGWRLHGRLYDNPIFPRKFTLDAGHVILAAGALGTTEILLRSEQQGLSLSPRVGTGFTGNGDFFGLAYNADHQTNVLGFGNHPNHAWRQAGHAPGPTIVGAIRYDPHLPFDRRILIEDLSFPSAYLSAVMGALGVLPGEDTDVGDELEELRRHLRNNPFDPYDKDNALNHTMLYLVMGHDDARGTLHLHTNLFDRHGKLEIDWDDVGRQPVFRRINEELRRHARTLGAHFVTNPQWHLLNLRHLTTAHPLGGCPLGEDYLHGAVDEFGRVFAGNGGIHDGLFVADGALIPSALGVNPFMTISALAERIAARIVKYLGGEAFPTPPARAVVPGFDPHEVLIYKEADLERIFTRVETRPIDVMINRGQRTIDVANNRIRNDAFWKGAFPRGHVLNELSSRFFTLFKKKFSRTVDGIIGVTSDADNRINVANTLEEITLSTPTGTLEAGRYILLRYTDPLWSGFYDIFKVINEDLLIGRVYLGTFPNGQRLFTFPMMRAYGFDHMTADDHAALYQSGAAPTREQLAGLWEMRAVANANHSGLVAYLKFDPKPDGRLEARYRFMGLLEGLIEPVFAQGHFQLNDFTPFHDEIRYVSDDFMVGKYTTHVPQALLALFGPNSLGLFHQDTSVGGTSQLSFFYTLTRSASSELPPSLFLQPLLDTRLPDGLEMAFDEEMRGYYFHGFTVAATHDAERAIEARVRATDPPQGGTACGFQVTITMRDLNEFFENPEHEAMLAGTIQFDDFRGQGPTTFEIDDKKSLFNYLRVNPTTQEAEMVYRLFFKDGQGVELLLTGRKYLQKDTRGGIVGWREILHDYTTLYCHLTETATDTALGTAWLKFRTFEDPGASVSFVQFLKSFRVTGTDNPLLQAQGRLKFMALTNQFVMREYDPLIVQGEMTADEVREAVFRGAEVPDSFSERPTSELHTILRETPTRPLETLLNRGDVTIDFEHQRIQRDAFWKGTFARDTLFGWEERLRHGGLDEAQTTAARYIGGSFWKRFDHLQDGRVTGHVVNYELHALPGKPVVTQVTYPDNNRHYFKAGDDVLLLTYTNEPYRIVYDVIKAIDANNCIGVMHLGQFPNGLEFATFVMARHNYPFEKMSVPDHQAIFNSDRVMVPSAQDLAGAWDGHMIFLTRPDISLLNQLNPVAFRLRFIPTTSGVSGRFRFGLITGQRDVEFTDEFVRLIDSTSFHDEFRMIDQDTLIGKWVSPADGLWLNHTALQGALEGYLEPGQDRFAFYYLLTRVS